MHLFTEPGQRAHTGSCSRKIRPRAGGRCANIEFKKEEDRKREGREREGKKRKEGGRKV